MLTFFLDYVYTRTRFTFIIDAMNKIKVLIADDHPAFLEGVSRVIADTEDIEVICATDDSKQAVKLAQERAPDVVVINVAIHGQSGIEATKKIRLACPKVGVIIVSAYTHGAYVLPSLRAGALGYMLKTSPLDELINCIRRVRTGETMFDIRATGKILRLLAGDASDEKEEIQILEKLHAREIDVLKLIAKGMHNRDVAAKLHISEHTVHTHLTNIFRKLGSRSRTDAVLHAVKEGWLSFDDLP